MAKVELDIGIFLLLVSLVGVEGIAIFFLSVYHHMTGRSSLAPHAGEQELVHDEAHASIRKELASERIVTRLREFSERVSSRELGALRKLVPELRERVKYVGRGWGAAFVSLDVTRRLPPPSSTIVQCSSPLLPFFIFSCHLHTSITKSCASYAFQYFCLCCWERELK